MTLSPLARRLLVFAAMLVVALIATIPLRVGVSGFAEGRFAAREAEGSLWSGTIRDAQFGTLRFGDGEVGLAPLPLLLGRTQLSLGNGSVSASRTDTGIHDLDLRLDTAAALAPLPIASLELAGATIRFDRGICREAEGTVRARTGQMPGGYAFPATFAGAVRCENGRLLLALASQGGMETVQIRLAGDGRYAALVTVRPSDEASQRLLAAAGFRPTQAGYALRYAGTLR